MAYNYKTYSSTDEVAKRVDDVTYNEINDRNRIKSLEPQTFSLTFDPSWSSESSSDYTLKTGKAVYVNGVLSVSLIVQTKVQYDSGSTAAFYFTASSNVFLGLTNIASSSTIRGYETIAVNITSLRNNQTYRSTYSSYIKLGSLLNKRVDIVLDRENTYLADNGRNSPYDGDTVIYYINFSFVL